MPGSRTFSAWRPHRARRKDPHALHLAKSTDKSVCATLGRAVSSSCGGRQDGVAQTLLSVLVKLGTNGNYTAFTRRPSSLAYTFVECSTTPGTSRKRRGIFRSFPSQTTSCGRSSRGGGSRR